MRLIDADALIDRMYHDAFETDTDMQKWDSGRWIRYKMFENAIDDAPTIVPKRGEWQYICMGRWMFRRCSCCEWTQTYDDSKYMGYRYNFCPNCGAKMNGERESDE